MDLPDRLDAPDMLARLDGLSPDLLDELPFGVIGFDADGLIRRYNRYEVTCAHFAAADVIGQHVFEELAPCFNNYLVAGVFDDAQATGAPLDHNMPYVLTFRMKPTPCTIRLLAPGRQAQGQGLRYVLVDRGQAFSA